jgi:hypothetical protein
MGPDGAGQVAGPMQRAATNFAIYATLPSETKGRAGMWRLVALVGAELLAGCTATPQLTPAPQPATVAANTTNVTRKLQNHWGQCLEQSYRMARAKTPDKNVAAEMAFAACASEEQDLASFVNAKIPPAYSPMPHLKAETKRVLIEEGHLPILSEQ